VHYNVFICRLQHFCFLMWTSGTWAVTYVCGGGGIDIASFNDFAIRCKNCSDSVVCFVFHFIAYVYNKMLHSIMLHFTKCIIRQQTFLALTLPLCLPYQTTWVMTKYLSKSNLVQTKFASPTNQDVEISIFKSKYWYSSHTVLGSTFPI
jgi:hypothetical protein